MGRKIRSEEGGSSSTATSASASANKLGPEAQFLVRAYESNGERQTNEYVTKGTFQDPYVVLFEEGQSVDFRFYDYAAYSDDANSTDQNISRTVVTDAGISGINLDNSSDYIRFTSAPNGGSAGDYLYHWNISNINTNRFDDGSARSRDFYAKITVLPENTIPVYTDSTSQEFILPRGTSDTTIVSAPSTQSSYEDVEYSVSGNIPPYAVIDSSTGRLYAPSVPDLQETEYTTYVFTISAVISESGLTSTRTYSLSIKVNDPFGAALFSMINARDNYTSGQSFSVAQTNERIDYSWSSGALQRSSYNVSYDTSPYIQGDGYGCVDHGNGSQSGNMWTHNSSRFNSSQQRMLGRLMTSSQYWVAGSNQQVVVFRWLVPAGVTSFAAVAVGGGAGGAYNWADGGGGGGGLAWLNGISCEPGEEFIIGVGLGRYGDSNHNSHGAGDSFVVRASTNQCLIFGQGGGYRPYNNNNPNGQSTSYFGGVTIQGLSNWVTGNNYNYNNAMDGGSFGYNTNEGRTVHGFLAGGGVGGRDSDDRIGAGAGGYRNDNSVRAGNNADGYGGSASNGYYYSSTYGGSAGGGVGVDGQGWGGASGGVYPDNSVNAGSAQHPSNASDNYPNGNAPYRRAGGGGSGGSRGCYGENEWLSHSEAGYYWSQSQYGCGGGLFGGGAGGSGTSYGGGHGASGAVRIIWGNGDNGDERAFPYIYTTERSDMRVPGVPD